MGIGLSMKPARGFMFGVGSGGREQVGLARMNSWGGAEFGDTGQVHRLRCVILEQSEESRLLDARLRASTLYRVITGEEPARHVFTLQ